MNSIYIQGDAGFKSAILTKLGGTWLHGFEDCEEDTLRFSIPEEISRENFKKKIGRDNVVLYNLAFFNDPPGRTPNTTPQFVAGRLIKMTIWANENYNLNGVND